MKVLLGVTGSVAAIRTPELYQSLGQAGHQVKIVATQASLYFFDPASFGQTSSGVGWVESSRPTENSGESRNVRLGDSTHPTKAAARNREIVILDEDEWPGQDTGQRYQRDDPVLHIELRRWADMLVIAPLDANTLAKLAHGLADNCLTCVWRAWDPQRPVILAPAMNTLMWEHPLTASHLMTIVGYAQFGIKNEEREIMQQEWPPELSQTSEWSNTSEGSTFLDYYMNWVNQNHSNLRIVPPVSKRLACGDVGVGAMASVPEIVSAVAEMAKSCI